MTTVRLASPQTPPGGETFVTVMLTNIPGEQVQTLETEIEYQTNHLTYVTARPGFAADIAGATVEATVIPVEGTVSPAPGIPPRARTRIAVTVTGKKPIPNGPVAELRFRTGPAFKASPEGVVDADHVPPAAKPGATPAPKPGEPPPPKPGATPTPPGKPGATADAPAKAGEAAPQAPRIVIVKIDHRSEALTPQGVDVPLVAEAGAVRVTTEKKGAVPIVFACFFYMH